MTPADPPALLRCAGRILDLTKPCVMGVLNITPDSFSDGGELFAHGRPDLTRIRARAQEMIQDGAAILDIGGESTRPGAAALDSATELARVLPVVEALAGMDAVLSVDTSDPAVMTASLAAGAGMINDVRALQRPGALAALAQSDAAACLMHMRGEPASMQDRAHYADLLGAVASFLRARVDACRAAGIPGERISLDPGFGFGKTLDHNLLLLNNLRQIAELGFPLLVGLSRKSTIGHVTGQADAKLRVAGSIAAAVLAIERGARIVRTHDVRATVDAINVVWAVTRAK